MLINEGVRREPEGENQNDGEEEEEGEEDGYEEDELDPRVEIELEKLNKASIEINILEKELDEARAGFRQRLTDAAKSLKQLGKSVGNHIDRARPYFEALSQSKKAQTECQNAAVTYEKACQLHKGARDTIAIAEDKLMHNPGMFDAAWQEMLNNANSRILEAEAEKLKNEQIHHEATLAYLDLERRASQLEKELRKSVNKAKPYFEQRAYYLGFLENQKIVVQQLEKKYADAKKLYSESLKNLEVISEEIHNKRNEKKGLSINKRGECIGAESANVTSPPTRQKSTMRRLSEERIKSAFVRQRNGGSAMTSGRYRHSLLLDLDIDFDIDDLEYDRKSPVKLPTSPGAKSVDIGCVNLKYYEDYQVLDVAPLLEKEKQGNNNRTVTGYIPHASSEKNPRSGTTTSEFLHLSAEHDTIKSQSSTTTSSQFDVISVATRSLERSNPHTDKIVSSTKKQELSRKDSKPRFSMIEETEDEVPTDSQDNLPENDNVLDKIEESICEEDDSLSTNKTVVEEIENRQRVQDWCQNENGEDHGSYNAQSEKVFNNQITKDSTKICENSSDIFEGYNILDNDGANDIPENFRSDNVRDNVGTDNILKMEVGYNEPDSNVDSNKPDNDGDKSESDNDGDKSESDNYGYKSELHNY